jgi:DNA-binding winged helix-turn-helix (wHTH) protein
MFRPDNHLYEFENFVLDAHSRILLKDGVTVRLTPKAFETLLVLIQHGVQVVDKDQLMKEVWPDTFVEEGSLSRNIYELRKALGDDSSEPKYIETIPKRGYRFLAPLKVSALPVTNAVQPRVAGSSDAFVTKVVNPATPARPGKQ